MNKNQKVISVFGSSRPQPGSPAYEQAYAVGKLLADAGYGVATGGYMGTMEAVSKGAHDANGHVIGVTSDQIESFRPIGPNGFIKKETRYATVREREHHLIHENDGMIALPGGIGTLAEVASAWSAMQTKAIPERPLILVGDAWRTTFVKFIDPEYVRLEDAALLQYADSAAQAVTLLVTMLEVQSRLETGDQRPER